ncbi:beta-galactosidase trimerization domain-containing protein [Paenibacillus amylolyticus]|nr:beta-galactosidase trimerization domain-containing protein [Paenibacillus amylolyticus]
MAGNPSYYKTDYTGQVLQAYSALEQSNLDCNIVNLRSLHQNYKLIIVPGHAIMDEESAATLRAFVVQGGTVIMTAYSAKVTANNQVFDTTLPGGLSDVFGIRCGAFVRTRSHTPWENAGGLEKTELGLEREKPVIVMDSENIQPDIDYYEILEPRTTSVIASFTNTRESSPAVTCNKYGQGQAIYVALPANTTFLSALLHRLYPTLGIAKGPATPSGVVARHLDNTNTLYVNTTGKSQTVPLQETAVGMLSGQTMVSELKLEPYDAEIIQFISY